MALGVFIAIAGISSLSVLTSDKPKLVNTNSTPQEQGSPSPENENIKVIELVATDYKFTPDTIRLSEGEEVKVVLKNQGTHPHNWVVSDLDISTKTINPGREDSVIIKAEKAGEYTFFCSVGNHRQLGMEGELFIQ